MNEHLASEWVIQTAFWSAVVFIAWYSLISPWYRYSIGRAIVAMDTAIALATFPTVLGLDFGAPVVTSPFYTWMTVAAFACIPAITIWRGVIVWKAQRRGARGAGRGEAVRAGNSDAG